jgi:histidinol-phosphate aminotransferase
MQTKLTRRNWFKSSLTLTAGLTLAPSFVESLMAAPVSEAERIHGIDPKFTAEKLIRLGSNENPYGPSEKARKAMLAVMSQGNRYGFSEMNELRATIAKKVGVSPDHILLGAGSSELLCLAGLGVGLEGGAVTSAFPVFRLLMDYAQKFNARWDKVNLDDNLVHNLDGLAAAIKPDTKILFLVNPNNPTGTVLDPTSLKNFCIEMSKKTLVYSDEAYLEFLEPAQQHSMVELVRQDYNVVVSRTFSKIYGLAGLRIGYVIAKPDLIQKMAKYQTGTIISQPAIAAAKACLADEAFMSMTRKLNAEARAHLFSYLDKKKWFYGKSQANVVFFPAPIDGKKILAETEKKGFQIRVWDYQDKEWCRVSIGTLAEMKAFTKAFDEIVS